MKDQLKMIVFVIILGIISAAIIIGTQTVTMAQITDNQEYALKNTILKAFAIESTETNVLEIYEKEITETPKDNTTLYYSKAGEVGFKIDGKGLWGPITGFMTLEADLMTIKAIQVIYNEETPGLGGVIGEQWYIDKFKGKKFNPKIYIKKGADMKALNEIDAITGATMTSNAFELLLNENYQLKREVLEL